MPPCTLIHQAHIYAHNNPVGLPTALPVARARGPPLLLRWQLSTWQMIPVWPAEAQPPQSIPTEAARRRAPVCPRRVPFGKLTTAHSASRAQFGVLVAHLDQCGILGARSTVARGGRGLRVRLHLFSCERKEAVTGTRRLRLHGGSGTQAGYNGDHLKQLLSPRSTCCSRGS